MSLNITERKQTIIEFNGNMQIANLTVNDLALHFQVSDSKINAIINLEDSCIENPWIIREYLIARIIETNKILFPFSKMNGSYTSYWFLDKAYISTMAITR